jgi:hypothetical protein
MPFSLSKSTLPSLSIAILICAKLGFGATTAIAASPEDEIARLNRVRANLFEELIKTRSEAATARAERDEAIKARDAAEAELARLKQEAASVQPPSPPPASQTKVEPQQQAPDADSTKPQGHPTPKTIRPADQRNMPAPRSAATTSTSRVVTATSQPGAVRDGTDDRVTGRHVKPTPRKPTMSATRPQELPSVLRLQGPQ